MEKEKLGRTTAISGQHKRKKKSANGKRRYKNATGTTSSRPVSKCYFFCSIKFVDISNFGNDLDAGLSLVQKLKS